MTIREGNLEAPTRHPVDWKNPEFYDQARCEKEMERIIRSGQRFVRRVVTEAEARAEFADEPYKLELIGLKGSAAADDDGAGVEVGAGSLPVVVASVAVPPAAASVVKNCCVEVFCAAWIPDSTCCSRLNVSARGLAICCP